MKIIILNAFSLSMLNRDVQRNRANDAVYEQPRIPRPCDDPVSFLKEWEQHGAEIVSAVGHADTAAVFSSLLNRSVACNRTSVRLTKDVLGLVGQYYGPRLQEGATQLPDNATIEWWVV